MSWKEKEEQFVSRWSRRKVEARRGGGERNNGPEGEPKPGSPAAAHAPATPQPGAGENTAPGSPGVPLPSIAELRGLESEYRDFLRPEVDESLRRTALKKLFQDPHFNIMDGLDTYIDDYTKADPIPEAMLRTLNQAQGLIFDRKDEPGDGEEPRGAAQEADRLPPVTEEVDKEVTEAVTGEGTRLSSQEMKEDGGTSQAGPGTPSPTT